MNTLHEQIRQAIRDRKDWEGKQELFYELRHSGLRRAFKPYPNAPDMHFPLVDSVIEKHKPFYVQQIYATESLAAFVPKTPEQHKHTSAVGAWFDYQLKQQSNFEREIICGIDASLQNGGAPIKVFWNERTNSLEFDACDDPLKVIVPEWTEEIQNGDWLVHVMPMSVAAYKGNPEYRKDDEFIKSITGKGSAETGEDYGKLQAIASREGITHGNASQIVVWEIYTRDPNDRNKIIVETRAPVRYDEELRPKFQMAYKEGVFKRGWFPFCKLRTEIKSKGYYSSRGVAEVLAPFETSLCKSWNFIHEWQDMFSRPMFRQDPAHPTQNMGNFSPGPGATIPAGMLVERPPDIPASLRDDMNATRQLAEYRLSSPDLGVMAEEGGRRTATAINAIVAQTSQGTDLRARVFRLDLGDIYKMAWALLLQYGKESLAYSLHGEAQTIDATALQDCYQVTPNGSADSWNKGAQMQKAVARFQMFRDDPFIKQGELRKSVLENDEAGLVPRLFQEQEEGQAQQAEEQRLELLLMSSRWAAAVEQTDDDKVHLQVIAEWFPIRMQEGPLDPITAKLAFEHIQQHGQALKAKKDPLTPQIDRAMKPISAALLQIAQPPQENVVPMQQEASNSGPLPPMAPQMAGGMT